MGRLGLTLPRLKLGETTLAGPAGLSGRRQRKKLNASQCAALNIKGSAEVDHKDVVTGTRRHPQAKSIAGLHGPTREQAR